MGRLTKRVITCLCLPTQTLTRLRPLLASGPPVYLSFSSNPMALLLSLLERLTRMEA